MRTASPGEGPRCGLPVEKDEVDDSDSVSEVSLVMERPSVLTVVATKSLKLKSSDTFVNVREEGPVAGYNRTLLERPAFAIENTADAQASVSQSGPV